MDGRIFDLKKKLQDNLAYDWNVEKMAEFAGLSISHFPRIFKTETGTSPGAFLKELRLEEATHLLETTHDQIRQIGIKVGMPNESHFTRDFKKRYGLTPTRYRRQFNDKNQADGPGGQKP